MNKDSVKQIFQSKFDYPTYCNEIVHNVFGGNDISTRPEWLDGTSDGDNSYYIGRQTDANGRELGFFYTRVAPGSDVRRKRVGLRKMIAPYLKYDVDAAIAVFADESHWRLSYICDMKEGVTSAKRFSYILGDKQGQYKTPLERLDTIYAKRGRFVLNDLREAFSVDALSDEFFDEYHIHYDRLVAELARQGKTGAVYHDYVKKLMGRIVFLHFLQKKGWLCGDTNFMLNTFDKSKRQDDYLESVLEPLFFGILNTEPAKREQVFGRNSWPQQWVSQWADIPYLNGGLFERDAVDELRIVLPRYLFSDLFSFLASYNFTVDENDPDDAEIGVDPEMLGKIFESLLEDNKAKGAFYTPKEIVRYMCKESLIAHLESKVEEASRRDGISITPYKSKAQCGADCDSETGVPEARDLPTLIRAFVEYHEMQPELEPYRDTLETALREVKICDPAIGSGAFPMGLLNELWRCREALGTTLSRLQLKKEIIENNIYGVDIERGAIDIARLRFWLSIVVDSEMAEPLPNFDYKFMQGNSLIESYGGFDLSRIAGKTVGRPSTSTQYVIGLDSDLSQKNLQRLFREYFSVTDHQKKATMRSAINAEVKTLIRESVGGTPTFLAKLEQLDPSANQDFFLWHTWFKDIFDKGGFDIVIGNPPYINIENLDENTKDFLFDNYSTCHGRTDIYIGFIEKATTLMNSNGRTSFIIPYSYTNQNYGELSRRLLAEKHSIEEIVDTSNYYVFDNAVVKNIIIRFGKSKGNSTVIRIAENKECFEKSNFEDRDISTKTFLQLKNCRIETKPFENILGIKEHIEMASIRLGKIFLVAYGVRVNNKYDASKPKSYYVHDAFQPHFKKFTEGKCIDRYSFTQYGWLNYRPEEHYNPMFSELFENEKLMFINVVSKGLRFAYDNDGFYNSHTVVNCVNISKLTKSFHPTAKKAIREGNLTLAKDYSTKYVLGVINSKLINWYFIQFQSEGLHCYPDDAKQFPIAKATQNQQQPIIELVNQILTKKRSSPNADTSDLEYQIDELVYELYGITEEEIAMIEQ